MRACIQASNESATERGRSPLWVAGLPHSGFGTDSRTGGTLSASLVMLANGGDQLGGLCQARSRSGEADSMKRVLILCTGNSCRSQMAEALWNDLGQGEWEASSAGSNPADYVHPLAVEVMKECDIDLSGSRGKHLREFQDASLDVVVTVCDNARESCPVFPGARQVLHWPFPDPAHAQGSDDDRLSVFRVEHSGS